MGRGARKSWEKGEKRKRAGLQRTVGLIRKWFARNARRRYFEPPALRLRELPTRVWAPESRFRSRTRVTSTRPLGYLGLPTHVHRKDRGDSHSGRRVLRRVPVPVPEELRAWRHRLGFDYGKFDFVVRDGVPILLDVNRTPTVPPNLTDAVRRGQGELARGIEAFLRASTSG